MKYIKKMIINDKQLTSQNEIEEIIKYADKEMSKAILGFNVRWSWDAYFEQNGIK